MQTSLAKTLTTQSTKNDLRKRPTRENVIMENRLVTLTK